MCYSLVAQKATKLRVGERIPFSKVSLFNSEDKVINLDLPDGKNVTDRFVLVYFYSSNSTIKQLIAFKVWFNTNSGVFNITSTFTGIVLIFIKDALYFIIKCN